jgi:hypothetical protein
VAAGSSAHGDLFLECDVIFGYGDISRCDLLGRDMRRRGLLNSRRGGIYVATVESGGIYDVNGEASSRLARGGPKCRVGI